MPHAGSWVPRGSARPSTLLCATPLGAVFSRGSTSCTTSVEPLRKSLPGGSGPELHLDRVAASPATRPWRPSVCQTGPRSRRPRRCPGGGRRSRPPPREARLRGARPSGRGRGLLSSPSGPGRGVPRSAAGLLGPQVAYRSGEQPTCCTSTVLRVAGCPEKLGSGADGTADPNRLDPVLADRLDPDRVAVGLDRVAALRQPPELAEYVAADRVVGVAVDRQVDSRIGEIAERDVPAHEPVAVGEAPQGRGAGVGLVLDLPHPQIGRAHV